MNPGDLEARDRRRRTAAAVAWLIAAAAAVSVAAVAGHEGAIVGAVLAGLLAAALAAASWPSPWSPAERRHQRLHAIWCSQRPRDDGPVPWCRYVAWAEADGGDVVLSLVEREEREPSPYRECVIRRVDPDDVEAAAEAMEALREEASEREERARDGWHAAAAAQERYRHERALREVDAAGRAELHEREARMRAELAEQDRAERRAQADAVAEALRRR